MNIYGFIVGIEKYDEPTWDVEGPCANAIALAGWLKSLKVPGENIQVFLSSRHNFAPQIAELKRKKVDVRLAGDANSIDTYWRTALTKNVPADSRLFVFWSGHGFTSRRRNRVFFCSDYQSK